jgi:hypothetical protein
MIPARSLAPLLAIALSAVACKSDPPPKPKRPGFQMAPITSAAPAVCTFGEDQTCNDDALISSIQGTCNQDGTCTCHPGFSRSATSGKCK